MTNYRPVYEHHGSTLSADSGYIYNDDEGRQFFDAFGKVIITQPSGTVIYADKLHYVAETQLATLTNNVRMVDGSSVLTTNYLTYKIGRAHVCNPVTNAQHVCRLLLEKKTETKVKPYINQKQIQTN